MFPWRWLALLALIPLSLSANAGVKVKLTQKGLDYGEFESSSSVYKKKCFSPTNVIHHHLVMGNCTQHHSDRLCIPFHIQAENSLWHLCRRNWRPSICQMSRGNSGQLSARSATVWLGKTRKLTPVHPLHRPTVCNCHGVLNLVYVFWIRIRIWFESALIFLFVVERLRPTLSVVFVQPLIT